LELNPEPFPSKSQLNLPIKYLQPDAYMNFSPSSLPAPPARMIPFRFFGLMNLIW